MVSVVTPKDLYTRVPQFSDILADMSSLSRSYGFDNTARALEPARLIKILKQVRSSAIENEGGVVSSKLISRPCLCEEAKLPRRITSFFTDSFLRNASDFLDLMGNSCEVGMSCDQWRAQRGARGAIAPGGTSWGAALCDEVRLGIWIPTR